MFHSHTKPKTQTPKKPRRRRKRGHYHTGVHHSPKSPAPINYRSGWELTVCKALDVNPEVIRYEYESLQIPYLMGGKQHTYTPDLLIAYKSGKKVIAEIKRADKLTDRKVIAKATAVRQWLRDNGLAGEYEYQFWTNSLVEAYEKLLAAKELTISQALMVERHKAQ